MSDSINDPNRQIFAEKIRVYNKYVKEHKWHQALEVVDQMIAMYPIAVCYIRKAMVLMKLDLLLQARDQIDSALAIEPDNQQAKRLIKRLNRIEETKEIRILLDEEETIQNLFDSSEKRFFRDLQAVEKGNDPKNNLLKGYKTLSNFLSELFKPTPKKLKKTDLDK